MRSPNLRSKGPDRRMERLMHCDETRARRTPPKSVSFGWPVSSRLRLEGGKFWRMWSSTFMVAFGARGSEKGRSGPVVGGPAALDDAARILPIKEIAKQDIVADASTFRGEKGNDLAEPVR